MNRQLYRIWMGVVLTLFLVVSCTPMTEDTPDPLPSPTIEPTPGTLVDVTELEVFYLESWPLQIHVLVRGFLRDGCVEIDEFVTERDLDANRYEIEIKANRDPDAVCTLALVPFEENVPLDVYGIPAGTYTVQANGVETTFTLDTDNVASPIEGTAPVDEVSVEVENEEAVVEVEGNLPDGCTEILGINQRFDAARDTFYVKISTLRPADALCTEALVPYTETLTLDLGDLDAGEYIVDVNGVTATFTLEENDMSETPEPRAGNLIVREALLDSMDLRVKESFPLQVDIVVRGNFRDGCGEFGPVEQETDVTDRIIRVRVMESRPADAMCTMALVPFTETFPLEIEGLPAGTYTVEVNGITGQLELSRDNVAP